MKALCYAVTIGIAMTDEQFRAIRGLLVTVVILTQR
jgi:hypothetical protein